MPSTSQNAAPATATTGTTPSGGQSVEVTGSSGPDGNDQRRRATASRITIGREELDRMGDNTLGEVLKRLPGVTIGGPPGRGGPPRMRGMGGGYTQILIDGQRMPPGFSLESVAPEQIERIEVMRSPVAEFGTRAIAGTINVVLRSDFKRKANELRFGGGTDGGEPQLGATLQRNGQIDSLGYNLTATMFNNRQHSEGDTRVLDRDALGQATRDLLRHNSSTSRNQGLFANGRLAWKLGGTDSLELQPFFNMVRSRSSSQNAQALLLPDAAAQAADPSLAPAYTLADTAGRSQWQMGRLLGVWQTGAGAGGRLVVRFGSTLSRSENHSDSSETGGQAAATATGVNLRHTDSRTRDLSVDTNGKFSQLIADRHSASAGWELQSNQRQDTRSALLNGSADPSDQNFGETFEARIRRIAVYAQDEWDWSKQLSFYVGLRWEGITTTSATAAQGQTGPLRNTSKVLSPLAHLVWKLPDSPRDQVRLSLTHSYRSPDTNQLIGRRVNSTRSNQADGSNTAADPDRVGNPALKPELSWSLETAFEHYLEAGGLLSANLYLKRIDDLIRSATTSDLVNGATRYVSRPVNIGKADVAGLELEAKLRAADLWATELPLNLRGNLSLMWSRVDGVPGPDNRIDGQPPYTLNLGADLPVRGTPLTLGGNLNFTPGFDVQGENLRNRQGRRSVVDAYATWRFSAAANARFSLSNATAMDYTSGSTFWLSDKSTLDTDNRNRSYTTVRLQAELRF